VSDFHNKRSQDKRIFKMNTILMIEDSMEESDYLRAALSDVGVTNPAAVVFGCADAIPLLGEAPYRARFPTPSVIFFNLNSARSDGFGFLHWLRAHEAFNDVLAVAMDGSGEPEAVRHAYRAGANACLTKPYRVAELENLIQKFPAYWSCACTG
jgi:CheY-like chemotaxis protein